MKAYGWAAYIFVAVVSVAHTQDVESECRIPG
jgi:hypothetical protein